MKNKGSLLLLPVRSCRCNNIKWVIRSCVWVIPPPSSPIEILNRRDITVANVRLTYRSILELKTYCPSLIAVAFFRGHKAYPVFEPETIQKAVPMLEVFLGNENKCVCSFYPSFFKGSHFVNAEYFKSGLYSTSGESLRQVLAEPRALRGQS